MSKNVPFVTIGSKELYFSKSCGLLLLPTTGRQEAGLTTLWMTPLLFFFFCGGSGGGGVPGVGCCAAAAAPRRPRPAAAQQRSVGGWGASDGRQHSQG